MRKIFTLVCLVLLGFSVNTFAQNSVTIPDLISTPGTVTITVEYDFTTDGVCGFEIEITFDTDELDYLGYSPGTIGGLSFFEVNESAPGIINFDGSTLGAPITNTGTIVFLEFEYSGGPTDLEFTLNTANPPGTIAPSDAPSILIDCDPVSPLVVQTTFNNGSVSSVAPVPLSTWAVLLGIVLIAAFAVTRFYRIV